MNYFFLKSIITSILANFHCPNCNEKSTENTIFIDKISDKGADIMFDCPKCRNKTLMKAELGHITSGFLSTDVGKEFLKKAITDKKIIFPQQVQTPGISQEEITKLEVKLSHNPTINDFINGE